MWRKAFVALLSINVLIVVSIMIWLGSLPDRAQKAILSNPPVSGSGQATVQLLVGDAAVNTYLQYAVDEQQELSRVLSYMRVAFGDDWDVQVGVKLADKVIPCDIHFLPIVENGDLHMKIVSATMGAIHVPVGLLAMAFTRLPWPNWITVDSRTAQLNINFTARPQHPYGVQVSDYSPQSHLLTLLVSIAPKSLTRHP